MKQITLSVSIIKQESPPVWTQEAYRPRRIKYYPRWGSPPHWGAPSQVQRGVVPKVGYPLLGYPPARSDRGTQGGVPPMARSDGGYLRWDTPIEVPPCQVWWGYLRWGTPLTRSNGGYLRWGTPDWGTPLARSDGGYPKWGTPQQGYSSSWTWPGYPPRCGQTDWWMDRHVSKYNLPSYYVRGR